MVEPPQDAGRTPDIPDAPPPVIEPPADVQPAMDPWAAFDRWAGNLFLLLALLAGLSFLLLAGAIGGVPGAFVALASGSIAVVIALLGVTMLGLRDHASWARPAAEALLLVTVAMGALQVVADLSVQKITLPIGAILALAVLWRRPSMRPRPAARDRRIAWLIGAAYVLTTLPGPLSPLFSNPPAFLIAQRDDLALAATTNCEDPARITPGEDQPRLRVTWRMLRDDVTPGGEEALEVWWDGAAPVELAEDRLVTPAPMTRQPSGRGGMALDRAFLGESVTGMEGLSGASWARLRLGIEGDTPLAREGTLTVPFTWQQGREPQSFDLYVLWAHDDHWVVRVPVACEPPADAAAAA